MFNLFNLLLMLNLLVKFNKLNMLNLFNINNKVNMLNLFNFLLPRGLICGPPQCTITSMINVFLGGTRADNNRR